MKKALLAALLAAACLLVAGCSGTGPVQPAGTATATPAPLTPVSDAGINSTANATGVDPVLLGVSGETGDAPELALPLPPSF